MRKTIRVLNKQQSCVDIIDTFLKFLGQVIIYLYQKCVLVIRHVATYYWHHKLRFCTDMVLALLLVAVGITGNDAYERMVGAQVKKELIADIDQHASVKRNFRRDVAADNPREILKVGAPTWLRQIGIDELLKGAIGAKLDTVQTAVLLAIADIESGFNPLAKARDTTACGVNQFLTETGEQFGLSETVCFNPGPNTRAQIKHFKRIINQPRVLRVLQGKTDQERLVFMFREVYCRHHDGVNMKFCSETAGAMTAKSLPMLFGAYKVLHDAHDRAADAHFFYAVYNTLEDMHSWALSRITSLLRVS